MALLHDATALAVAATAGVVGVVAAPESVSWYTIIRDFGYPAAVSLFVMLRLEPLLREIRDEVRRRK